VKDLAFCLRKRGTRDCCDAGAGLQEDERFGLGPPSDIAVRACSFREMMVGDYVELMVA